MKICEDNKCTGCGACENACALGCISLKEDNYGELHPVIDKSKCTNCKLCKKSCPNNIELDFHYPTACYAAWITDNAKRRICASGGLGTIISEHIIRDLGGVVFGSRYDKELTPIMTYTEKLEELERFKGSRYVQSIVDKDTFRQVKQFLNNDRYVLFVGTPCQIAGMKAYLRKPFEKLYTVDLICHGVCPTKYFKEEVKEILRQNNLSNLSDIRFRGNDGHNYCLTFWSNKRLDNSCQMVYKGIGYEQYYLAGFLLGVSMRENCYTCNYARPERVSDITIGDFIGLGTTTPFNHHPQGGNESSITINTEKGTTLYKEILTHSPELVSFEREYTERLEYKPSLVHPFERHKLNAIFRERYTTMGYVKAIRKTLKKEVMLHRMNRILNYWTLMYRVPRKIYRIVKTRNR